MHDRLAGVTFDEPEYERWRRAARERLETARALGEDGHHPAAVLIAQQATQLLLKALLHGVGAGLQARGHELSALADRCAAVAGMELPSELRDQLLVLERDYLPTRYPDALAYGTPSDKYRPSDVERALRTARLTEGAVDDTWTRLQQAAGEDSA